MSERPAPRPINEGEAAEVHFYYGDRMADFEAVVGEFILDSDRHSELDRDLRAYLKEKKFTRDQNVAVTVAIEPFEGLVDPRAVIDDPLYAPATDSINVNEL